MYDRWAEELRKGTTARSNLTTSAPRKEMSPSNASIVRVRDMVCIDASVGDPKIQPRHCHGGVGYVVEVEGVGSETVVAVKHEKLSSGVGTEYGGTSARWGLRQPFRQPHRAFRNIQP